MSGEIGASILYNVKKRLHLSSVIFVFCCAIFTEHLLADNHQDQRVLIGVLAYNGEQQTLDRWNPTAKYLAQHIDGRLFEIVPLTHEDFVHAINKGQLDFILTNPGHYTVLEVEYGATRIATFKARFEDRILTHFSSVIFTRRDSPVENLQGLRGRTLAAVSSSAFGGFQLAQAEFLNRGLDIYDDSSLKWLGFPHTDIVRAVLSGTADAGTVRTGILEKMAARGEIDLSELRVQEEKFTPGFPLLHSTELYPEWPIAQLPDTDARLAKQVAITLLQMPENSLPAIVSEGAGWTIPLDYRNVHELFRRLQVPPYPPVPLKFSDFWRSYRGWVSLIGVLFLGCVFAIFYTLRINRELKHSQQALSSHQEKLEAGINERTAELSAVNQALQQDIESRIKFENTLHEGCEILQTMYTISSRTDLTRQQRMQSIVDLARQYLSEEVAVFSIFDGESFQTSTFSPGSEELSAPLDSNHALQALESGQIVHLQDDSKYRSYLACSSPLPDHKSGLLEFACLNHDSVEVLEQPITAPAELGLRILHLLTQWVGNELTQLESENKYTDKQQQTQLRFADITQREREVLQLVADGESNKDIARKLEISAKTVELHRANLIRKTATNSSIQLIKLATASGIVT